MGLPNAYHERDRELRDVEWIAFEVRVPREEVPDYLPAQKRLWEEQGRICPAPLTHHFILHLRQVV